MPRVPVTKVSKLQRRIRLLRERADMTQTELAKRLGTDKTAVSHWESGRSHPRAEDIPAVARALAVSIAELYGEAA